MIKSSQQRILASTPVHDKELTQLEQITEKSEITNLANLHGLISRLRSRDQLRLVGNETFMALIPMVVTNIPEAETITFTAYIEKPEEMTATLATGLDALSLYLTLVSDLPKTLISEDLIESGTRLIAQVLKNIVQPLTDENDTLTKDAMAGKSRKELLKAKGTKDIFATLSGVLDSLTEMINSLFLQESWIYAIQDALITVLFLKKARKLHLSISCLITAIFARLPSQRQPILNELIVSLTKLTEDANRQIGSKKIKMNMSEYNVTDKIKINFSTFMIVQLLQSCNSEAFGEILEMWNEYNEQQQLANFFSSTLLNRLIQNETPEQKLIFSNFIEDLLKISYFPEFPSAYKMIYKIAAELQMALNEQVPTTLRNFFLEKLGTIATALATDILDLKRSPILFKRYNYRRNECGCGVKISNDRMLECKVCKTRWHQSWVGYYGKSQKWKCDDWIILKWIKSKIHGKDSPSSQEYVTEVVDSTDAESTPYRQVEIVQLDSSSEEEEAPDVTKEPQMDDKQATADIRGFMKDNNHIIKEIMLTYLAKLAHDQVSSSGAKRFLISQWCFQRYSKARTKESKSKRLESALNKDENLNIFASYYNKNEKNYFLPLTKAGAGRLFKQLVIAEELWSCFDHIRKSVINKLDFAQPLVRSKALKTLAGIIEADPYYLRSKEVERAVQSRLQDWSITVREAAVDLLGRYVVVDSELSQKYCAAILRRIKDKGPLVRKKVVNVLADICLKDMSHESIAEMMTELVKRVNDNSDLIINAVQRTFEKIWSTQDNLSDIFIALVKNCYSTKPLVELFNKLVEKNKKYSLNSLKEELMEKLIKEANTNETVYIAKGLEILCEVQADKFIGDIFTLQHFLTVQGTLSDFETSTIVSICQIIEVTAPHITNIQPEKVMGIEEQLYKLIFNQGTRVIISASKALCSWITHVTHNTSKLEGQMNSWIKFLELMLSNFREDKKNAAIRALFMLGLMFKYIDTTQLHCLKFSGESTVEDSLFNLIWGYCQTTKELLETSFETLCLAWIRFPTLLYRSEDIINMVLSQEMGSDSKIKILQAFQGFLTSLSELMTKYTEQDIGNMLSILDKFLPRIIDLVLDSDGDVRRTGVEVLNSIQQQGHINPMKILPALIALQADYITEVRDAAYHTIEMLLSKQPTLINRCVAESLKTIMDFQRRLGEEPGPYNNQGEGIFVRIYCFIKNNKTHRNKFLNCFVQILNMECQDTDLTFFICYWLASIDYSKASELVDIVNHVDAKTASSAQSTYIVLKNKTKQEDLIDESLYLETMKMAQILSLKLYLHDTYGPVNLDEGDKPVEKASEKEFDVYYNGFLSFTNQGIAHFSQQKQLYGEFKQLMTNYSDLTFVARKRIRARSTNPNGKRRLQKHNNRSANK